MSAQPVQFVSVWRNGKPHRKGQSGFSLLEFLIAMTAFVIICAAGGLAIHPLQQKGFTIQQNQSRLNLGLRNAIAQLQIDVANGGSGFYPGPGVAMDPLGIVVTNANAGSSSSCYNSTSKTYTSTCFDTLSILSFTGTNVAPAHPASTQSTTSSSMILNPPTGITAANYSAALVQGTQILLMKSDASQYATVVLTANSSTYNSNTQVQIQYSVTNSNGTSTSTTTDPLGLFLSTYTYTSGKSLTTGTSFGTSDWALAISSVTYYVDTSTSTNPKLMRKAVTVGSSTTSTDEIAEQIIGFQVGAGTPTPQCATGTSTSDVPYNFNAANYCYNWTQVQSVRVSIVGRTNPSQPIPNFQNAFDQGAYKIEALTAVISPRNLVLN
jgi:prepilin-type N-terminal cleavage/methylation domain-containing protein